MPANRVNVFCEERLMSRIEAMVPGRKLRASLRMVIAAQLLCAASAVSLPASALPVIPGLSGFGSDTAAGRGGTVYRVTNLNDTGTGSLRACVNASGPRVCVFEVSGTIRMAGDLDVRNPGITIAGQTAPSPGIVLRGGAIWVKTSDVLVQHLRVRPGDDSTGSPPDNRDALKISAPAGSTLRNVVIDHCSFTWAIDETASIMYGWDNVTLSNNILGEPLHDSIHPKGPHGFGVLVETGRVTMKGNLFYSNKDRNPHSRAPQLVMVNNVVYNPDGIVKLGTTNSAVTRNTVVGNVFIPGPDTRSQMPIQIRAGGDDALPSASRIYLADNQAPNATNDPWSIASYYTVVGDVTQYRTNTPPTWTPDLTRLPTSGNAVLDSVLRGVGARPADRDAVDSRIVEGVRTRSGRVINCVAPNGTARCERNAGGWPNLPANRRTLTLPSNPNEVTPSGYTRLELWLHEMAAEVEGRTPSPPAAPRLISGS
jgi:hypothetical protein